MSTHTDGMQDATLDLTLADPAGTHFQGPVLAIRVQSALGVYEALPGHCPMTLVLHPGPLYIRLAPAAQEGAQGINTKDNSTPRKNTIPEDDLGPAWTGPEVRTFVIAEGLLTIDGPTAQVMTQSIG